MCINNMLIHKPEKLPLSCVFSEVPFTCIIAVSVVTYYLVDLSKGDYDWIFQGMHLYLVISKRQKNPCDTVEMHAKLWSKNRKSGTCFLRYYALS